ncbi:putative type I restriction-modification system restriction subunit [Gemmatimonas aurantiaca T-27]|uniref:Putative type I restriction-modification system restriction subunit n=1 Tax=Gemmatimonas aurantiaca (strain DSM 14586 / JCM 11422 / NBRC 100505 / T-27) TaxID=379066 RepID=C1A3Q2_GEMAT|nr:putative type I restriction-modification system restriction subunit [Gemmatimonas aurantiaca T-27]
MKSDGKAALVPRLRFPEFRGAEGWKSVTLGEVSTQVTEIVGDRKLTPVSISAGIGFVPQAEKFGRDISGNQYQRYTLVRDGDFVFNKGNSLKFPQGCVYLLHGWGQVAAPSVFICFRLRDGYSNGFFQNCFEQNQHGRQLKRHITSGARSNGLLNISKETFFGVEIPTPTSAEQQKIAECLSSADELIAAQARKVDALKTHKKGLMQQLFPREGETQPRLRFPDFRECGEWELKAVGDVFEVTRGKVLAMTLVKEDASSDAPYPVYSSQTKSKGLAGYYSEYLYRDAITWTTDGANAGDVNFRSGPFYCTNVCGVLVNTRGYANACVAALLNGVTRSHVSYVGNPKLMNGVMEKIEIPFPSPQEQQRIAECLSSLDALITAESDKLEALKHHKRGLMQQLFPSPVNAAV